MNLQKLKADQEQEAKEALDAQINDIEAGLSSTPCNIEARQILKMQSPNSLTFDHQKNS